MRTCPSDGTVLLITRRSSVEIDTCPLCRGVWLDRGELDKIIARADHHPRPNLPPSMPPFRRRPGTSLPASTRGGGRDRRRLDARELARRALRHPAGRPNVQP